MKARKRFRSFEVPIDEHLGAAVQRDKYSENINRGRREGGGREEEKGWDGMGMMGWRARMKDL